MSYHNYKSIKKHKGFTRFTKYIEKTFPRYFLYRLRHRGWSYTNGNYYLCWTEESEPGCFFLSTIEPFDINQKRSPRRTIEKNKRRQTLNKETIEDFKDQPYYNFLRASLIPRV